MDPIGAGQKLDMLCLRGKLLKNPPVENLFLSLTSRCGLSCRHCWYRNDGEMPDMPVSRAMSLISQAEENGIPQVTFFGGEPSLYPGLEKLVLRASALNIFTELDTNGQNPSLQTLKKLSKAGLSSVMVSLHSEVPGEHDLLTGEKGSHRKAVSFIKNALKAGLICYVSVCFFKKGYSRRRLSSFALFCRRLGVHGIRSLFFCGAGETGSPNLDLTADIKKAGLGGYIRDCFSISPDNRFCAAKTGKTLYVDAAGNVKACPYSLLPLGNIRSRTLSYFMGRAGAKKRQSSLPCRP